MEENMDKQKTWRDADDLSGSVFHFLRLGETIEGNVSWSSLMPSLKHVSVVKTVTALWNRAIVQHEMTIPFSSFYERHARLIIWKKIEGQILADASEFVLPRGIHKMLINAVKPIGMEILEWVDCQDKQIFFDYGSKTTSAAVRYVGDLAWTSRGRIDQAETAKVLLTKEDLCNEIKYRIACSYCLEEEIINLAPKVLYPGYIEDQPKYEYCLDSRIMTCIWTRHLANHDPVIKNILQTSFSGKTKSLKSTFFNSLIFQFTPFYSGKYFVAVKYFWRQLSSEEKEKYVKRAIGSTLCIDDKLFFLTQVSNAEVREIAFKGCCRCILHDLINDWLWKDYFVPTVRLMWKGMIGMVYLGMLRNLIGQVMDNCIAGERNLDLREMKMFLSFWECSPDHLKEYVFEHDSHDLFLRVLSEIISSANADAN